VNLDDLDMSSIDHCVLAQVLGSYDPPLIGLSFGGADEQAAHGFEARVHGSRSKLASISVRVADFTALTAEWRRVIIEGRQ
jgi:hypothetical protein